MLADLKTVLRHAQAHGYAVPAFDCVEDIMIRTILDTCEELRAPAILMGLIGDIEGRGWHYVSGMVRAVAPHYTVPVVLHLDHAMQLDQIRRALDLGFTSVMIDGSRLPFTENVKLTRAAVELAHAQAASVEAELGHVGGSDLSGQSYGESVLTESHEVQRFVAETNVDALAVSVGTAHGIYRALPKLNLERLSEIRAASNVPLVLHGGSGTPDDQIQAAVKRGITKLNIYADNRIAMCRGLKEAAERITRPDLLPGHLFKPIRDRLAETVEAKIRLLFAVDRV